LIPLKRSKSLEFFKVNSSIEPSENTFIDKWFKEKTDAIEKIKSLQVKEHADSLIFGNNGKLYIDEKISHLFELYFVDLNDNTGTVLPRGPHISMKFNCEEDRDNVFV
jgi:intein-encoded DNA endonuclease-like protein